MESYCLGKDIQDIKMQLAAIQSQLGVDNSPDDCSSRRGDDGPIRTFGERTSLVVSNRTFRDFHVEMSGDVHTGSWGPYQLNHNQDSDADSKKIDFGDRATFHVMVYKNNAGRPGDLIGEFDHKVRYNAAGRDDRLEFVIITLSGQTYLEVISIRAAARVALYLWLA
jgi:hypothetical protein